MELLHRSIAASISASLKYFLRTLLNPFSPLSSQFLFGAFFGTKGAPHINRSEEAAAAAAAVKNAPPPPSRSDPMLCARGREGGGLAACPPPRRCHHVRKGTPDAGSRNLPILLLSSNDANSDRTPEQCTGVAWFRERPAEVSGRRFATASPKLVGIIFAPTCGR